MKKIIIIFLMITLTLNLTSCGKKEKDNNNQSTKQDNIKEIGTRSNPYRIGDSIILNDITDMEGSYGKDDNYQLYSLKLKVTDLYKEGDIYCKYSNSYYVAKCEFYFDGNNDDEIRMQQFIDIDVLSDEMIEADKSNVMVSSEDTLSDVYTGIDYNIYLVGDSGINYKYAVLHYFLPKTMEQENIYILLED